MLAAYVVFVPRYTI